MAKPRMYYSAGFIQNAVICLVLGAPLTAGVLLALRMITSKKTAR